MTQEEANKYWNPARKGLIEYQRDSAYKASIRLAEIVGVPYPCEEYMMVLPLTPELKRKLEWLAGPHCQTIIKVLEAQKGVVDDTTEISRTDLQETR